MPRARWEEAFFPGKLGKLWGALQIWGQRRGKRLGGFSEGELTVRPARSFLGSSFKCLLPFLPPAALPLLTPLYRQLYHEDGILLLLWKCPKKKPGLSLPAPLLKHTPVCAPACLFPLALSGGVWRGAGTSLQGGLRILHAAQKSLSPSLVAFPSPQAGGGGGSGCGEEAPGDSDSLRRKINCQALQEVYHCHPRLAGSHLSPLLRTPACIPGSWGGQEQALHGAHRWAGAVPAGFTPSAPPGSAPSVTLKPGHVALPLPAVWLQPCCHTRLLSLSCAAAPQQGPPREGGGKSALQGSSGRVQGLSVLTASARRSPKR